MMCTWCGAGQCGQAHLEQRQGVRFEWCAWEVTLGAKERARMLTVEIVMLCWMTYGHTT